MVFGKVYGVTTKPRYSKILITAAYSKVEIATHKNFTLGISNREPSYLKKFPLGQAPALETSDGKKLTECFAIINYIAEQKKDNPLLGKDAWERSQIIKFGLLTEAQMAHELHKVISMVTGEAKKSQEVADSAYTKLHSIWSQLEGYVTGRDYLIGDRLTLADIDLTCALMECYKYLLYPEIRSKYPELERYFMSIVSLPLFQEHNKLIHSEKDFLKDAHNFS